ncbi:MAG: Eco57I restriction-modification methylase domain-containing protein [Dissulfurispiraceae bacterium]
MKAIDHLSQKEKTRLRLQVSLDAAKTQEERNRLGQFSTPTPLALDMLTYAKKLMPIIRKVHFLDPALGTGAFYSALLRTFPASRIATATGYEVDPYYGDASRSLWSDMGIDLRLMDFTSAIPPKKGFNLVICNPPYVRHHHILNGEKARIQAATYKACDIQLSGLSGLYCHFLGLSHNWMAEGGLAGWLIPSEFMDVNYGKAVKQYLLDKVRLLHIHRFDPHDVQFNDALVSSAVVWFKKETPPQDYKVEFSFGGTLSAPKISRNISTQVLRTESKWTRFPLAKARTKEKLPTLSDFFSIHRGIATGNNNYFILTAEQIAACRLPQEVFKPILPSPRYLPEMEIQSDEMGNPILEKPLYLLDCRLPEKVVKKRYPSLWLYLSEGKKRGVASRYLCSHRSPWYSQENRPAAPFVCTYLGRGNVKSGRPFRFILNLSNATITNVYLALYPKGPLAEAIASDPSFARHVWESLNRICPKTMLSEGRVYGGGLYKLEPKELANVPATDLADLL